MGVKMSVLGVTHKNWWIMSGVIQLLAQYFTHLLDSANDGGHFSLYPPFLNLSDPQNNFEIDQVPAQVLISCKSAFKVPIYNLNSLL